MQRLAGAVRHLKIIVGVRPHHDQIVIGNAQLRTLAGKGKARNGRGRDAAQNIEVPNDDNCGSDFWPTVMGSVNSYQSDLFSYGEMYYDAWGYIDQYLSLQRKKLIILHHSIQLFFW